MRKLLLFAASLLTLGAGCLSAAPAPVPAPSAQQGGTRALVQIGETFTLKIGESRDVQGGLRVRLESIGDSRCRKGVQCFWAGELSPKLLVERLDGSAPPQEVTLGTLTRLSADAFGYRIGLKDANESEASIVITR